MEDNFSQESLDSSCISQTIDELTQLHEAVSASTSQSNTKPTSSKDSRNTSQGQVQGHTSTDEMMNYQQHTLTSAASHIQEEQVLDPHYIIVEDPISLHSYADFSSPGMFPSFGLSADKDQPSVLDKPGSSVGYENYASQQEKMGTVMSEAEDKSATTDVRTARKETILTVPVIEVHKASIDQESFHINEGKTSTLNEVREQLKEHLNRKEAESFELRKQNMTNIKERKSIYENVNNFERDGSSFSTRLTKDSTENINILQGSSLPNSAEASTNTEEEDLALLEFSHVLDNEISEKTQKTQERITLAKTTFSENLGLIPAENEMKIIEERAKNASKGVRTRKSLEIGILNASVEPVSFIDAADSKNDKKNLSVDSDDSMILLGHKHHPGCYRCGSCAKTFMTICKLHDHLQDHCFGGSYHYDHLLKTAFPKYDTTCSYSQTNFEFDKEQVQKILKPKKGKMNVKFKAPRLKAKPTALVPVVGKRKRGRPRKIKVLFENVAMDKEMEEMETENDNGDMNDELNFKEDIVGYNIDGTVFDTATETDPKEDPAEGTYNEVEEKFESIEDNKNASKEFVENYLKDLDDEITNENTPSESKEQKKKPSKRKNSIPRKIMVTPETDGEKKIVNSRSKPDMKITCEFCPSKFQYTRGLIRHEQEKHADQMKYDCDQCEQKFMREYNLERHKLCSHTDGKSKLVQKRKGIYREKKKPGRRPIERTPEPVTPCEICGKDVPSSKLDIHIRLHTGERPYICHVCGKGLISEKKLKRHLLIHSEVSRHTCSVCGQGFSMKYKLRTHMFVHTGHKPYLCSVCGAEFNNSTSLLHHNRTVHLGDKRFECTICGGKYGKKSQLEEHMFSHSSERTQTCKFCGKTFKHAKSLRRHEFTHISDQKLQCDQCDSKFSRKDNLERHKMCHYDGALQCSFCKKKFRERQPLLDHEQFHINQKKHTCQICKERFQDEAYFYNHMENNHGITRDMVPMINALASSPVKEGKQRKSMRDNSMQNLSNDQQKAPISSIEEQIGLSVSRSAAIDTLNLSMSVAGILPTAGHELMSNMQPGSMSLNNLSQQVFNICTNTTGITMNQPVSSSGVIPGINDVQRMALNVMNTGLDQTTGGMALNPELMSDQHRMMQEVVNANLPNMQGQGYRLQNLFNQ